HATVLREGTFNRLGYQLHADRRDDEAVAVLEEATRRFPASANAWDSLSEIYEVLGRREPARAAVQKGLAALAADAAMPAPRRELLERSLRERAQRLGS